MTYHGNIPRYYIYTGFSNFLLWMPVWVIFFQQRGLSLSQIAVLELVSILLLAVSEVPTGVVADIFGRKASMAIGAALHGAAVLGVLTEALSLVFIISYCLWAMSFSFLSGASEAFAYDTLKADHATAHYQVVASREAIIRKASLGIAAPASGLLAIVDLRLCFVGTAIAVFVAAGVIVTGHEPPTWEGEPAHRPSYLGTLTTGARVTLTNLRVRYVTLATALLRAFTTMLLLTAIQQYGDETGLPVWALGSVFLGIQACSVVGSWYAPRAASRYGQDGVVNAVIPTIALLMVLLWASGSAWAIVLFGVAAAITSVAEPILSTMLNDAIPSRQRATIISLQSLVSTAGLALTQFGVFMLADRTSMAFALGASGVLMIALGVPLLVALSRSPRGPVLAVGEGATPA